jgi:coatomer protein complex subunit alpha (xenin)
VKKNPMSAGINVAAGNFDKALELLGKSIALSNYEPLKQLFIDTYTLSKMKAQTLPHGPAFDLALKSSASTPLLPVSVQTIEAKMQQGIELTTKADF